MANLVVKWVNEVGLSRTVTSPEAELANGYLLGELLSKLKIIDEDTFKTFFKDSDVEEDKLRNFAMACKALKLLMVKFDERQVARIMTEQYGSAASLLIKVRDYAVAGQGHKPDKHGKTKALISVRPKAWKRKVVQKSGRAPDFIERLIEEVGHDNFKALDMALHLKKFEDRRLEIERGLEKKEQQDLQAASAAKYQSRELELTKAQEKAAFFNEWLARGRKDWSRNMRTHRERFKRLLQYEVCLSEQRDIRRENSRRRHRQEEVGGIEWFEMNMLRLGVGGADKWSGRKELPSKEDALTFLHRIRAAYEVDEGVRRMQVGDLMAELKEKAVARRKATREKEIRRRKEACDHLEAQSSHEQSTAEDKRVEQLIHKVNEESEYWHAAWLDGVDGIIQAKVDGEELDREVLRQAAAREQAVADFFSSLADVTAQEEERRAEWRAEWPGVVQARQQAKHHKAVALVSDVVEQLVDLAVHCGEVRARAGRGLLPSEWQEFKDLFVAGHIFYPPRPEDEDEEEELSVDTEALVDVQLMAEAVAWHHAMRQGQGPWQPAHVVRAAEDGADRREPSPVRAVLETVMALTASDKPATAAPRADPPPLDTPPLAVAVLGDHAGLADVTRALESLHRPSLALVTPDLAVSTAQRLGVKVPSEQDKQAIASSPAVQALAELGAKHLSITCDPKNPGVAAPDQLTADIIAAYVRAYVPEGGGWMLVGYPATPLQAKLLERGLTGYTDAEVTEYVDKLALAGKKKPPAKPPAKAATAAAATPAGDLDPPAPALPMSAFDAVLVVPAPPVEGEVVEQPPQPVAPWSTFQGVQPPAFTLPVGAGQSAEWVAEGLDMLLELVEEEKAAVMAEKAAAAADGEEHERLPPPTPAEWMPVLEEKRAARVAQLSLAARMWKEHCNGGRQLDLETLEVKLLEPWEAAMAAYHKEVHRAMSRLVTALRPVQELEAERRPKLSWLLHTPLSGLSAICHAHAQRLSRAESVHLPSFLNGLEVELGAVVEARYDEVQAAVDQATKDAEEVIEALRHHAVSALQSLVGAEGRRAKAQLRVLSAFDEASNVADRQPVAGEPSPALKSAIAALSVLAESERGSSLGHALAAALSLQSEVLGPMLAQPLSKQAFAELEQSALRYLEQVDGIVAFWVRLDRACDGFAATMAASLRQPIPARTTLQHEAVARVAGQLAATASKEGVTGLRSALARLGKTGIEVDESQRAPASLGPTLLDSGLHHLPPESISALIYALRSRSSRSSLLRRDSFVRCVTDCLSKSAAASSKAWQDPNRVAAVASALDPKETGMVNWRRFIHCLLLAHLPQPPTLASLLVTRAALRRVTGMRRTSRGDQAATGGGTRRLSTNPLALRIRTSEFLDLPLWFEQEADGGAAQQQQQQQQKQPRGSRRPIKELYALLFTEEDGKVSLSNFLLMLCECLSPLPSSSSPSALGTGLAPPRCAPLLAASVLFTRPFRLEDAADLNNALRAFELHVGSESPVIPVKVLEAILQSGSHLHTPEATSAFLLDVLLPSLQQQLPAYHRDAGVVPLDRLVTSEVLEAEGLMAPCHVYRHLIEADHQ